MEGITLLLFFFIIIYAKRDFQFTSYELLRIKALKMTKIFSMKNTIRN